MHHTNMKDFLLKQISILTKTIHDNVGAKGAIKHYIEDHGSVPLWVLVNYLTIGNLSYLYVTHRIQIWRLFSKSETVWIENPPLDKALTFKKRLPHKHDIPSSVFINFLIYLIPINLSP